MITGIDLSESLLKWVKEKAAEKNMQIVFQNHDTRRLPFFNEFSNSSKCSRRVKT